jgi:thiol-disulfide isomerase/thioredoxin
MKLALVAGAILVVAVAGAVFVDRNFFLGALAGLVVPLIAVGLLFAKLAGSQKQMELAPPPIPTGNFDYVWTLKSLDGTDVSLESARGKVIFVNVWATWCGPCVAEMPSLQRLHERVRGDDVFFAFVTQEPTDVAKAFLEKHKLTLPVFTMTGELPPAFKRKGIPSTFVVSKRGAIAFSHVGAARWDDARTIGFLDELIRGS